MRENAYGAIDQHQPSPSKATRLRMMGVVLLTVLASGCAPATADGCKLDRLTPTSMLATVVVTNRSAKTISALNDVLFSTSEAMQGFPFRAHIEPGQTMTVAQPQPILRDGIRRPAKVIACRVHAITYSDGSQWWGPSDI